MDAGWIKSLYDLVRDVTTLLEASRPVAADVPEQPSASSVLVDDHDLPQSLLGDVIEMTDASSLLSVYLQDMRVAIEAQLRHLTTVQRSLGGFHGLALSEVREAEKASILAALHTISDLSRVVDMAIPHAIRQADVELSRR